MLRGRDLAGRALDQRGKAFARESTTLNAKTLGLCFEFRPVGEAYSCRVEEPKQVAWRAVVDVGPRLSGHLFTLVSPVQVTPITG
jgi:hypothetical protein